MKLSSIAVDAESASEGRWREFAAGWEVKIASADSPDLLAAIYKAPDFEGEAIGPYSKGSVWALSRAGVRDWKGLEREDGTAWPYSPEDAFTILCDPRYFKFLRFVVREADEFAAELSKAPKAALGN